MAGTFYGPLCQRSINGRVPKVPKYIWLIFGLGTMVPHVVCALQWRWHFSAKKKVAISWLGNFSNFMFIFITLGRY